MILYNINKPALAKFLKDKLIHKLQLQAPRRQSSELRRLHVKGERQLFNSESSSKGKVLCSLLQCFLN